MHKERLDGESVFVVHDFLSGEECDRLIARSEAMGYEAATVGDVLIAEFRNNGRVIRDDPALADELWARARPFVPEVGGWKPVGLNPRFRFYRYDLAEAFAPHYDGSYSPGDDTVSRLTFMVYLNERSEGGETNFYFPGGTLKQSVRPERGKALVFLHMNLHEGAPVTAGRKYVLRSDVMFRRPTASGLG